MIPGFGGLTANEKRSAVMSGASSSKGRRSKNISLFGADADGYVDFTNPNTKSKLPKNVPGQEIDEFRGLNESQRRIAVMSGAQTINRNSNRGSTSVTSFGGFIDMTEPARRDSSDARQERIIEDVRSVNRGELSPELSGLTADEKRSAVMSGAQTINRNSNRGSTSVTSFGVGTDSDGFIDITAPARRDSRDREQGRVIKSIQDKEFNKSQARDRMKSDREVQQEFRDDLRNNEKSRILQARRFKEERKDLAEAQRVALIKSSAGYKQLEKFNKGAFEVGKSTGQAVAIGLKQQVSFSREQEMLGQMFGQGDKIWGTNNQPVTINNDLNSRRSDPFDETAGMFGFGGGGERSGLF